MHFKNFIMMMIMMIPLLYIYTYTYILYISILVVGWCFRNFSMFRFVLVLLFFTLFVTRVCCVVKDKIFFFSTIYLPIFNGTFCVSFSLFLFKNINCHECKTKSVRLLKSTNMHKGRRGELHKCYQLLSIYDRVTD